MKNKEAFVVFENLFCNHLTVPWGGSIGISNNKATKAAC